MVFLGGGYLFVEFFFALSGFVLAHSYAYKKNLKFRNFFISRTFRIFPLHIFMLFVFIFFEFAKLLAFKYGLEFNNEPFTNTSAIKEILPNLFLLQSWLPTFESSSWNYPSWSISVEYYIYMIFFFTLFLNKYRNLVWFLLSLTAFLLLFNNIEILNEVFRGLLAFFAGNLLYILYLKTNHKIEKVNNSFISLVELFFIISTIYLVSLPDFEHKSIIANFLFMLVVYIFSFEKGILSIFLKKRLFSFFGKLSYSIYMIHAAVIFIIYSAVMIAEKFLKIKFTYMIGDIRSIDFGNIVLNNILVFAVVILVILVSTLTYKYIEVKGQKIGKRIANLKS